MRFWIPDEEFLPLTFVLGKLYLGNDEKKQTRHCACLAEANGEGGRSEATWQSKSNN